MPSASASGRAPPSWPPIGSTAIDGTFDLILSNPPYLASGEIAGLADEVAVYDPMLALDGGPDGLDAYRRIAARAADVLAEEGRLLVEIGAGQATPSGAPFSRAAGLKLDQAQGSGATWPDGRAWSSRGHDRGAGSQGRRPKKGLENRDVQVRFVASERLFGHFALGSARPVATATRADFREPRLQGSPASRDVQETLNRPTD